MAANYLHGVETIEAVSGGASVTLVKTAVVGLVGTAVSGPVGQLVTVLSEHDFAQFGDAVENTTIVEALNAIYDQGGTVCQVVNVLDPLVHNTAVPSESLVFDVTDTATLAHQNVVTADSLRLSLKSADDKSTYAEGKDYTLNATSGVISRIKSGKIKSGEHVNASYHYIDPTKVTPADVIGGVDKAGLRTGMQIFLDGYSLVGYFAKLLVAPGFSTLDAVATALRTVCSKIRAVNYIDAPAGLTVQQAIEARSSGDNNFYTSDPRTVLCYPYVQVYDAQSNANKLAPLSARAAGLQAARDRNNGYWWSASNQEIQGVVGIERPIYAMINDPDCEANQLNAAGITTVFASYGTGYRFWGNRSAAYPSSTVPTQFVCIRRTADIIEESLEYFTLQYMDGPLSDALIDVITEAANGFLRKLIADGAILDGKAWYDPKLNPVEALNSGHITLSYDFMPPPPAESITYKATVNINYLREIGST